MDLRFLQDPSIYHQLSTEDVPAAFLESQHQPAPDALLADLIQYGHFRRAAQSSLLALIRSSPDDAGNIFQLLCTRLACLTLISRPDLASHEAIPLTELLARNPSVAKDIVPLVPWDLRLLLVRLQAFGAADGGRRGVMALYQLASEVRANVLMAKTEGDQADAELWSARLCDLGLRVADALVEMGEFETATRHLETLEDNQGDEIPYRKALLRVRVGDATGAQQCLGDLHDADRKNTLEALLKVADGDFASSTNALQRLVDNHPQNGLLASNLAVSMLYTGHITQARELLEDRVARLPAFGGMLYNLSTIYELCTEGAVDRKTGLTRRLAARPPQPDNGGWERANFDFKL